MRLPGRYTMRQRAFTLIELLIVVAIIGILAAIAVPNFLNAQVRARIAQANSNMRTFVTANEMYRSDKNTYLMGYAYGGASNWNEYLAYNDLTTPVAYLSSLEAVIDPFRKEYVEPGGNTFDQKFEYTPRKFGSSPPNLLPKQSANYYLIEGVGPDQVDRFSGSPNYPSPPGSWVVYNPSNGLLSDGDMYRAVGVFVPKWLRDNPYK